MLVIKRKGTGGLLLMTLIAVAISGAVAIGLTKMNQMNFLVAQKSNLYMQARYHAYERANILRSTSFSALGPMSKTAIGDANGEFAFYEDVLEKKDTVFKEYTIRIFENKDATVPLISMVVRRVDPHVLVDGKTTVSSTEKSDTAALSAGASQDLMANKIGDDWNSNSNSTTMSAKVFKEYVNNLLLNYQNKDTIVKRPEGQGVGGPRNPVFVNSKGFAEATILNYRLNENLNAPNVGILVKDSNGNFYLDYESKADFLKN